MYTQRSTFGDVLTAILGFVAALAFTALVIAFIGSATSLIGGYVIMKLWTWYLVPLGVKAIGVPEAAGISLLASILNYHDYSSLKKKEDDSSGWAALKPFVNWILTMLIALALGGIIHFLFL